MTAELTTYGTEVTPEPFTVVTVVLEDGRLTRAVWTGWDWWGEHRWLPVVRWEADPAALQEA
jgi:hypothetical protein